MKTILFTSIFGALCAIPSLSAKAGAGMFTGTISATAGTVFFADMKAKGLTAVGKAVIKNAVPNDADVIANSSILKDANSKATISGPTTNIKKKAGAMLELTAGGSYWINDNFAVGADLSFASVNAKMKDEDTERSAKASFSASIMPTVTCYMTDHLFLHVGCGVAWTKVKDLGLTLTDDQKYTDDDVSAGFNAMTDDDLAKYFSETKKDVLEGKFVTGDIKTTDAAPKAKIASVVDTLNKYNASVVSAAQKSFKTKPCFSAKISVGYDIAENSNVSLGYKYTGVKAEVKKSGTNEVQAKMHSISATYSYSF